MGEPKSLAREKKDLEEKVLDIKRDTLKALQCYSD